MQLPRKSFLSFSSLSKLTTFPALSVPEFQIWYFTNCWIVWNMLQLKQNSSSPSDVFHQSVNSFFSHYIPCAFYSFGIKLSSGNTQTEKHERGEGPRGWWALAGERKSRCPCWAWSHLFPWSAQSLVPGFTYHLPCDQEATAAQCLLPLFFLTQLLSHAGWLECRPVWLPNSYS